jgi:predicted SnoaL-like aldol condensation-catalyzing enzyme
VSEEEQNLAVIAASIEAYNDGRIEERAEMYSADAHLRQVTRGIDARGRGQLLELWRETLRRFPERRSEVVRSVARDDMVVTETRWDATVAESGDRVAMEFCYVFRLADGKITEQFEYG